jgi:uncharacterized lipoprotein NlpE involved in copper resistance
MRHARLKAAAATLTVLAVMFTLVGCTNTTTTPGGSNRNGTGGSGPGNMMNGSNNASQTGVSGY